MTTVCWVPGTINNRRYALEAYKFLLGPVEYVCRVHKNGVTVLGKVVKALFHSNTCKYIWNGEAYSSSDYDLLGDTGTRWKSVGYTMDKAILGGFSEDGKPTLICRAWLYEYLPKVYGQWSGRLSPPSYNKCKFVNKGTIHKRTDFEVLVNG
ncbi:uncharacterized protein LOC141538277 [Cotesia typhae]|uniref:uncharacterized protein LOC141538277 n=1 Tax=Cotesia typhae TaxID=2053667 RepID=UPI003D68D6C9